MLIPFMFALVIGKALGFLEISWLWAFAPLWIPGAVFVTVVLVICVIGFFCGVFWR